MSVKLHSVCKITQCVCVKLHTVCEITQCAQNYTYSIGKNSSQLENFTLTPLAALATNMSCAWIFFCLVMRQIQALCSPYFQAVSVKHMFLIKKFCFCAWSSIFYLFAVIVGLLDYHQVSLRRQALSTCSS